MIHDLITIGKGVLYCRQCKQTWGSAEHHLARQTECVGDFPDYPLYSAHPTADELGKALIEAWEKEMGRNG